MESGRVQPPGLIAAVARLWKLTALLIACGSAAAPVHATRLLVPDQAPTIQAAVDALVDTILVRAGSYPETVQVRRESVLMAAADPAGERPAIAGLTIRTADLVFRDLRFDSRITVQNGERADISFVRCELRAGVVDVTGEVWTNNFRMFKCRLGGEITPGARFWVYVDSCYVTGNLSVRRYHDLTLSVVGSTFQGNGSGYGIHGGIIAGYAVGNTVRGYAIGIVIGGEEGAAADNNLVEDCSDVGLIVGGSYSGYARNNVVRRCGRGIEAGGDRLASVSGNTVTDCAGVGLRVASESFDIVENVVSRCGDGIAVWGDGRVMRNTSCLNRGSGFVSDHYYDGYQVAEFTRNIGYGNGSYGILWRSTDPATVTCNDWFANQAGAVQGRPPSGEDFSQDPVFCDPQDGDFHLRADSPLLDRPGCGLVGALGQGCDLPVAFEFTPGTLNLSAGGRWVTGNIEPSPPFLASDIDIASVRLNGTVPVDPAASAAIGDSDQDGIADLTLKFDRTAVGLTLPEGDRVPVVVTGIVAGESFSGSDSIRVRHGGLPPRIAKSDLGTIALSLRGANPTVAGRIEVEFALRDAGPARLDLLDVAGRVLASRKVGSLGPGLHTLAFSGDRSLAPGVYFLRLTQGAEWLIRRAVVLE